MSYLGMAYDAIETVVARKHPDSSDNWANIEPTKLPTGWGLDAARWSTEARQIQTEFHRLIAPKKIWIPNSAIDYAGIHPLDQFQVYLAEKAKHEGR
jgi:hypothetical protein